MKNKRAVLFGILAGLFSVLFGAELFQAFIVSLTGSGEFTMSVNYFYVSTEIIPSQGAGLFLSAFVFLSPLLFSIVMIEAAHFLLKKKPLGMIRFILIIFNLINAGYLIIKVFYGTFTSIVTPEVYSDWNGLLNYTGAEVSAKIVLGVFSILLLTVYFNISSRRVMKYIG